jgi:hypothetical protein
MSLNKELQNFLGAFQAIDTMKTNASKRDYYKNKAGANNPTNPSSPAGQWVNQQAGGSGAVPASQPSSLAGKAVQWAGQQLGIGGSSQPGVPGALPLSGSAGSGGIPPAGGDPGDPDYGQTYAEGGDVQPPGPPYVPQPAAPQQTIDQAPVQIPGDNTDPSTAPTGYQEPPVVLPPTPPLRDEPKRVTSKGKDGKRKALDDQSRTEAYDPDLDGPTGALPLGAPAGGAAPATSAPTPLQGQGAVPAGAAALRTTQSPDTQGDAGAGLSTNNAGSDLEQALHGGMTFAQQTFHLNPADPHSAGGQKALFSGVGAATPDVVKAMDQRVNANLPNDPNLYNIRRLEAVYRWYSQNGQTDQANKAAFELLQYSAGVASQWGARATEQYKSGDVPGAIKSIQEGYNHIPDGNHMTVQGNTATIVDKRTGQPVNQFQFTPEQVFNAAMGLNNRSLYWQVLAQRVGQTQKGGAKQLTPEQEELQRARIENIKARTARLQRPSVGPAGGPGTGTRSLIDTINAEEGGTPGSPKANAASATPVSDNVQPNPDEAAADAEARSEPNSAWFTEAGGKPTQADELASATTTAPDSVVRLPNKPPRPGSAAASAPQAVPNESTPAGNTPTGGRMANYLAANKDMKLTPQERALYQRHLDNLGSGGVKNADGSTSTLFQMSFEQNGKTYNIPTVWKNADGKPEIVPPDEAIKRANAEGIDKFPSYGSNDDAEKRYGQMHDYMEKDVGPDQRLNDGGGPDYSAPDKVPDDIQIAHDGDKYVSPKATIAPDLFPEDPPKKIDYSKYRAEAAKLPTKERTAVTTLLNSKQAANDKLMTDYNNRKKAFDQGEKRRVETETKAAQTDLAKSMSAYDQTFKGQELNRATTEVDSALKAATAAAPYGGQTFDDPTAPEAKKALADNAEHFKGSLLNDKQVPPEKLRSIAFSLMTSNPNMTAEKAVKLVQQLAMIDPNDATYRTYTPVGRDVTASKNVVLQPNKGAPKFGPVHMRQEAYDDLSSIVQGRLKRAATSGKQASDASATAGAPSGSQDVVDKAARIGSNAKGAVERALTIPEKKSRTLMDDVREAAPKVGNAIRGAVGAIPGGSGAAIENVKPSYPAYDYSKQGAVPTSGPR